MRILHVVTVVSSQGAYGGPTAVATQQARELRRRGHDVVVLAGCLTGDTAPDQLEGSVPLQAVTVRKWLPAGKFAGLMSLTMLGELWRGIGRADVVHIHYSRDLVAVSAGLIARMRGRRLVLQTHGMVAPDRRISAQLLDRLAVRTTLRAAAKVLYLTDDEREQLLAVGGAALLFQHVENGVRTHSAPRHEVESESVKVLFAARLHPRKRVMTFLLAAGEIREAFPHVQFLVAGPDEGDLENVLGFIEREQAGSAIQYLGSVPPDQMPYLFGQSDIYVLPSVDEPFPMSVLEAMSHGVCSIITTDCGLAARVQSHRAALVIEPNLDALRSGLIDLLSNKEERRSLGERAHAFVRNELSIERVTDTLEAVYSPVSQ